MDNTEFHTQADATLDALFAALETKDAQGAMEVEYADGVITVELPDGKTYIINKHSAMQQIWMSSPISGGVHFRYEGGDWVLPDGRKLIQMVSQELKVDVA